MLFWTKLNSIRFKIERKTVSVIIFHWIRKENCQRDHIPLNSKGKLSARSYFIKFKRKTVSAIIFHWIQKENCQRDHISLNSKGKLSPRSYFIEFKRKTVSAIIFHWIRKEMETWSGVQFHVAGGAIKKFFNIWERFAPLFYASNASKFWCLDSGLFEILLNQTEIDIMGTLNWVPIISREYRFPAQWGAN